MYPSLSRLFATAERNVADSRKITEAQRALVRKLTREGGDATVARRLLRAAQATEDMFKAHFDQLKRLTLPN
jgi:predicted component of type VI protein secretion system